jgi:BirA family biotin operon repressor/biotin-[acetyl-CoA-carboxylase] ligase
MSSLPFVDDACAQLATERFGQSVRAFEAIGSTSVEARTWAQDGAAEGSLVVADHQTQGRGRQGRTWADAPGQSLLFSLVLRPRLAPDRQGLITLAAGLGVADGIAAVTALSPAIKWPNDLLLDGRKCCGMLLETTSGGRDEAQSPVVLGVGLNVNQTSFPDALSTTATSLSLAAGRPVPRAPLLAALLTHLERRYDAVHDRPAAIRAAYEERMHLRGDVVTLRFAHRDDRVTGRVEGVAPDGGLRLTTDDGPRVLYAGEVTLNATAS